MFDKENYISLEESKKIKLSKNFTLYEFIKSDVAIRHDIDNSLPKKYLTNIQYLVDTVLQPLRDIIGPIRITSGYRCEALALKVKSSTHSNHCFGLAADIEPYNSKIPLIKLMTTIYGNFDYKELIAEFFPNGWVHVAAQKDNNLKVVKLKDNDINYNVVSMSLIYDKYSTVA